MKIFIIINSLLKGGAEKQALYLTETLSADYNVTLIILNSEEQHFKINQLTSFPTIKVHRLKGSKFIKYIEVFKILKKHSPDYIFSYLLETNFLNGVIGSLLRVPNRIGGIRNSYLITRKFYLQRFIHNKLNSFTIFNNLKGLELLTARGFDKRKAIYVPNCISKIDKVKRNKKACITILTVARFDKAKDYLSALEAFKRLVASNLNVKYNIVGYGEREKIVKEKISKLNLRNYVTIHTHPENIEQLYMEADIYLQLSLFEGLSNSILEAMSFSLPIIATNVGDNDRLVKENENGFLVKVGNVEQTVDKLKLLVESHELRLKFGAKSYEIVNADYSTDKFRERYAEFIRGLS